ncbi:type II toxin-antitoxin system RelE/ParE family toxin [Candidatus Woesearchaeota archaeon]|nr:type II toxin-antitoxin system RelE/ParE family toxin [Candidatus Woesearchaeota archaeon]
MLEIGFSNQAERFLRKCSKDLAKRIVEKIKTLREKPVPHNSVSIAGESRMFRIRIGDYRVLYEVRWEERTILISKIDHRKKVYD